LTGLQTRSNANLNALADWVAKTPWVEFLAATPEIRSNTSVCIKVVDPRVTGLAPDAQADFAKKLAGVLEKEGVALDAGGYRDAPPGLRIWCGATVDTSDIEALTLGWTGLSTVSPPNSSPPERRRFPSHTSIGRPRRMRWRALPQGKTHGSRVLIADELSPAAVAIFKDRGIEVDVKPGLTKEQLLEIVDQYDGLAVRSATKPNKEVIAKAKKLKVIGRAGIGVDNVDIPAATAAGIVVMNTPFGNSITTAEHAIAMMFALARQLPQADTSTQAGKWEKNRFMGIELFGKTLG